MWSRVAKALDPRGDGRYDVEYRVKQLDGSWRWLSAWGLVEFEGDGPERKPVAIAGASSDLTERKAGRGTAAAASQRAEPPRQEHLGDDSGDHRADLAGRSDLPSAREALDRRIRSMAQAHDLLTPRAWTGANLTDVVMRALDAFTPAQVKISGVRHRRFAEARPGAVAGAA